MAEKTIFVTVGTTQFDQLIRKVTEIQTQDVLLAKGFTRMVLQVGRGVFNEIKAQKGMQIISYNYKNSLASDIQNADLIISHAGAGSCIEVLEEGKPLLVVVNQHLMDNHQVELAIALKNKGYALACNTDTLLDTLEHSDPQKLSKYEKGDCQILVDFLDRILGLIPNQS